jgi:uncharacterized Zn finger protein (UPF0148 family)
MSKKCVKCGATVPGSASLFCNKCGARLPAEGSTDTVICPTCGKTLPDRLSQFCDRCGAPLSLPAQPLPPVSPLMARKACPACGFENRGENLFYCKKCGTSLSESEPLDQSAGDSVQAKLPRDRMVNLDALPRNVNGSAAGSQVPSDRSLQEIPQQKGQNSYRKIAIGIVGLVLILIAAAIFVTNNSGIPGTDSENSTAPGLLGMLPFSDRSEGGLFSNQATPVVTDTPLKTKK